MSVEVYTYDDPKGWRKHTKFNEIKDSIHICATRNMADGIREAYKDLLKEEFLHVFTIREVISTLQMEWHSAEKQLQQYLKLSRAIFNTIGPEEIKEAFKKNKKDVLETIRFLVYAGLKPKDLNNVLKRQESSTRKESMFFEVWENLEMIDSSYGALRREMEKGWSTKQIIECINKLMVDSNSLAMKKPKENIVLHGFYFITPEQQRFLQCVKKSGIRITFFNLYDERFTDTFEFTRAFISERYGWTDNWKTETTRNSDTYGLGSSFLSAYEEKVHDTSNKNKKILRYNTFFEFMNKVIVPSYPIVPEEVSKENTQIIATNADMLNELLIQYYPDKFTKGRNFLQYPIGQFISNVHNMRGKQTFLLDIEILTSSFSSGWLYNPNTKQNARDYIGQLKKILPYFEGCEKLEEDWIPRFEELLKHYDDILKPYEKVGDSRIIKSMRSPLTKISQFSLSNEEVRTVHFFFQQLVFIARELFIIESEETKIAEHFKKVFDMISRHDPRKYNVLADEETQVLEMLNEKLSRIEDDTFFLYEDVGEAVSLYLSGKLEQNDEPFIKPFIEVDGEAFKTKTKFFLTGLDEIGLPLNEFSIPWPLQSITYEELSETHSELELDTLRNKSIKYISRYLFFIALEFLPVEKTELSWMESYLDKKNLKPAIYVQQMGFKEIEASDNDFPICGHNLRENPYNFEKADRKALKRESFCELTSVDYLAEYQFCPKRFYYSYILSEFPTFLGGFVQQFHFTELVRVARRVSSASDEEIIIGVGEIFPEWTNYKKLSLGKRYIRSAGRAKPLDEINDSVKINRARVNFQFPGMKTDERDKLFISTRKNEYELVSEIEEKIDEGAPFEAKPGVGCRYCPHLDICMEGELPVDKVMEAYR